MAKSLSPILAGVAAALNGLPGVFSTPQWGGRAYKLPGPGGNRNKPKLLAHVYPCKDGKAVGVSFKLPLARAQALSDEQDWIRPHSFKSLGRSGWVDAMIRSKGKIKSLAKLLAESRSLYPTAEKTVAAPSRGAESSVMARHIAQVMTERTASGWKPSGDDDDFDKPASSRPKPVSRKRRARRVKAR